MREPSELEVVLTIIGYCLSAAVVQLFSYLVPIRELREHLQEVAEGIMREIHPF